MEKNTRRLAAYRPPSALASLLWLLLIYLLFAWFVSHSPALNRLRWDITQDRLFSLSPGTRRIVESITEPIQLRLFFSPQLAQRYPALRAYKERVDKLLGEMQLYSHGRLQVHWLRPEPFSREEDLAFAHGLRPMPNTDSGQALFFGISGTNSLDGLETLAFLSPEQEPFLEYQLARLIDRLVDNSPRQIAIISQLSDDMLWSQHDAYGMGVALYPLQQDMHPTRLSLPLNDISRETDLLLLVHPPPLDATSVAAIGRYLDAGGAMAVFVDPLLAVPAPLNVSKYSDLAGLAALLGVTFDTSQVLVDEQRLAAAQNADVPALDDMASPLWLTVTGDAIDHSDILTRDIQQLNLVAAGSLTRHGDSDSLEATGQDMTRLLWHSGPRSGRIPVIALGSGDKLTSMAALASSVNAAPTRPLAWRLTPRAGRKGARVVPGSVVVVADVDWLFNQRWAHSRRDHEQMVYRAFADNGKFFYHLVDHLSSNADLISIPPRHHADRPFTRVESLRRQSQSKFRQTEQRLIQQLRETERILNQWQQNKSPQDKLILTPEQQQELQRFRQVKLDIREKLRAVRHRFDQDVAALGRWVLLANLLAVPVLLVLTGLAYWRWRQARSRRLRQHGAGIMQRWSGP